MIHVKPNRVSYLLTPAGIAEKARMSRMYFASNIKFYAEARERIRESFTALSCECSSSDQSEKRIVFYGAGEVAEIGFVCLQDTDLRLVAVVDERRPSRFFGLPVLTPEQLTGHLIDGMPYDRLVVMSFGESDGLKARLEGLKVPLDRVFWLTGTTVERRAR